MKLLQVANVATLLGGTGACAWSVRHALPSWSHRVAFVNSGTRTRGTLKAEFLCGVSVAPDGAVQCGDETWQPDVVLWHNTGEGRMLDASDQRLYPDAKHVYYQHSEFRGGQAARRHCDAVLTVSKYLQERIELPPSAVLYQPVPAPLPEKESRPNDVIVVGRLCTPRPDKWRPADVLPLYTVLARRFPQYRFEFVGCPIEEPLREILGPRATFFPASTVARSYFHRWHYMCYASSLPETYGRTVCEAQSAGCVPVVSHRGGFREQIQHGVDGFLCLSTNDFIHALSSVRDFANLSAHASTAGTSRGSPARWAARFQELLRGL